MIMKIFVNYEQLMREAYAELGVADLPQDILEGLFEMSNNQESFMENFKNMGQSDKEWFEKLKPIMLILQN